MKVPPNAKYAIIQEMTRRDNNLLNISWLCEAAGVSRSGYYYWLSTEKDRQFREEQDKRDFAIILEAYQYRGYNKGARSIYMRLLHMEPPVHMVKGDLVDTCREASISAFPFQLTVYEDIESFNRWAGFDKEIQVDGTEFKVRGFSEKFIMPGGTLRSHEEEKDEEETYTFLLGTVQNWQDVCWKTGENELGFVITWLDTALGMIPAAMSKEVFDLSLLKTGAIIAMNADIKADLSNPGDYNISASE